MMLAAEVQQVAARKIPAHLEVQSLRFRYRKSGDELFNGLDHTFAPGQITAVTGPSGRGKSTLLYVLGLLLTPSTGEVLVNGQPASKCPDAQRSLLRANVFGFVFQDAELDPSRTIEWSVTEPGTYAARPRSVTRAKARELLDRFGLGDRRDHRPGQISGGQAQRVALCRALINDPAVVLADEPTGNLDRGNSEHVINVLEAYASEARATVVIATHDPFVLSRANLVIQL